MFCFFRLFQIHVVLASTFRRTRIFIPFLVHNHFCVCRLISDAMLLNQQMPHALSISMIQVFMFENHWDFIILPVYNYRTNKTQRKIQGYWIPFMRS
jgi:hypothetical protein